MSYLPLSSIHSKAECTGEEICFFHGYQTGSVHSFMFELYCYNHWAISFPETNKWAGNFVFSDLLNITASPNNGTRGSLYHTLKNPPVLQKPQQFVQCQSVQPIATNQLHRSCNCSITAAVIVLFKKWKNHLIYVILKSCQPMMFVFSLCGL